MTTTCPCGIDARDCTYHRETSAAATVEVATPEWNPDQVAAFQKAWDDSFKMSVARRAQWEVPLPPELSRKIEELIGDGDPSLSFAKKEEKR